MATYSNYQLPNNMYNNNFAYPTPVSSYPTQSYDQFSSSAPPTPTSTALVPSYGPPPAQSQPMTVTPVASSEELDIIASQERAWELAKSGRSASSPSSSSPASSSSRQMVPHGSNTLSVPGVKVDHKNRPVSDAIHPKKYQMRKERKNKTAVGVASGVLVGTLVAGPVGFVVGGAAGGYAANKISKRGERRAQRHHEQASFQHAANQSGLAEHAAFA